MITLMRTTHNQLAPILILALSFILCSSNLYTQEVRLGLSMTPNVSWLKSTDGFHTTDGVNGNFGYALIIDFVQNDWLSFSSGLHVFDTGGKMKFYDPEIKEDLYIQSSSRDYRLKYVELPLSLKARYKQIGYSTIYGQVGVGLGLNIGVSANIQNQNSFQLVDDEWIPLNTYDYTDPNYQVHDDFKLLRASYIVGAGVERELSEYLSLIIGVNFNSAFLNIHKESYQVVLSEEGLPSNIEGNIAQELITGNDKAFELVLGLIF